MSVEGLCEICLTGPVEHTCSRCGSLVCDRHYNDSTGLCIECHAEVGKSETSEEDDSADHPDGVDTYRS